MFESCRGHVNDDLLAILSTFGNDVVTDPDVVSTFTTDWTRRFHGPAAAVLRPRTVVALKSMLVALSGREVAIQIQGGNTGLVGGSVPPSHSTVPVVIVSTTHLKNIDAIDDVSGTLIVDAGVTLGEVNQLVSEHGWSFGVDLAARDTATIGGMCATNAGGIRVCAFGMMRENITGIEFVTLDGKTVSTLDKPAKNNTGLQLANLAIGSEGVLGVISRVRLRLRRASLSTTVAFIPCESIEIALGWVRKAQTLSSHMLAAEIVDATTMSLVINTHHLRPLWSATPSIALLLELEGDASNLELPDDALIGVTPSEQRELWKYRELASDSWTAVGDVHKLDVSVPLDRLPALCTDLAKIIAGNAHVTHGGFFGHLADGNLHIEIVGPAFDNFDVDREVLEQVATHHGSVSAEHGIGRAKAQFIHLAHDQAMLTLMADVKHVFDPHHQLNPGVIFPS